MSELDISAKVIADTISPEGVRITSLQLCYPRFILPELNTHRVFSRSTASSRAIPTQKLLEQVRNNPAMPVHWGQNKAGMQAETEVEDTEREQAIGQWLSAAKVAADYAASLHLLGIHKQVANRLIEPFMWAHTIVTATDWDNFFKLRLHPDAQPEIQALAWAMAEALDGSSPEPNVLHLPYVDMQTEFETYKELHPEDGTPDETFAMVSAARCARVSYMKHDGTKPNMEDDMKLANQLAEARHMSPFEHCCQAASGRYANFNGWIQYRAVLESRDESKS